MPLANYTNLDFGQVKTTLREYLKENSNFPLTYDFEGSNLSTFLMFWHITPILLHIMRIWSQMKVFIDSATLRENVVSLARNIGYLPRSRKAATSTISFFFVDTSNITPVPSTIPLRKVL